MSKEQILELRVSQQVADLKKQYNHEYSVFNMGLTIKIMDTFKCTEEEATLIIDDSVDEYLFY